jgi:hypothetical protein
MLLVHARRARRVGLVVAAVATLTLFMALLASPALAAEPPTEETVMGADAPSRTSLPAEPASRPPGPAMPELEAPRTDRGEGEEREGQGTRWYGWQTLVTDGVALFLATTASSDRTSSLGVPALMTYGLGGPIVHLAHGRPGAAFGSFAARAGLPLVGFGVGMVAQGGQCGEFCILPVLLGMAGIPAAIALDAAVIAREPVKRPPPSSVALVQRLTPSVAPRREGGVELSLAGAF